jgi:serine/threonine-protein kinase
MAGSLAVVLGSASGGLWVAGGGDPPRSALPGPGAAGLGAAVATPTTATDPAAAAGGGSVTGGGAADPGVARDGPTPGGPGQPPGPGAVPADPTGSGSSSGPSSGTDGTGPASPAPAPAPTGAPPTGMAPPDGTDSGAGSPTAPAPPAPVEQTWLTGGGTVTAACDGGSASLVSWAPLPDYTADQVEPGPANEVRIVLSGPESRVEVTIHCESGAPVAEIVAS